MRIQQIRFKNLNSLVGEWLIDLTHPAFVSDGVFAITGPTGAGKSTILDAICLALYGRTPRLNKVTKGGNEIMSRHTGECFAEVIFETQNGRYRCHWSQQRAHKKSEGELQAYKHEISNPDTDDFYETKPKEVAKRIEEATGMDFERFTRSMLLAQGGFDIFLKAEADERAPILEQITGTEIYSKISIRVHERLRKEQDELNILQAEIVGIAILEPEQEKEIALMLEVKQKEETELSTQTADTGKAITWLNAISGLNKEISNLAEEASKLQIDIESFKPDRERLNRALGAASLDGSYATLTATRKQQAEDRRGLKAEEEVFPILESSAKEQTEALISSEQLTARAKDALKAEMPTLQKVRSLEQKLADQKKAASEGDDSCRKAMARIDADKKSRFEEINKRANAHETLDFVGGYLKEHAQDEWLISGLAGVEEQFVSLLSAQKEIVRKEADLKTATETLTLAIKAFDDRNKQTVIRRQKLEESSKQSQQGKEALSQLLGDRLLREYHTEKETLLREMAFLTTIAKLQDHRAELEDGKPCPLCGATAHPFAEGNVPILNDAEQKIDALTHLIIKAEDQEFAIKKLEEAESLARKSLTEAESLELAAASDKKSAEKTLTDVNDRLLTLRSEFAERRQAVSTKLHPLGIADIPENGISSLIDSLRARRKAWQDQVKKKGEIEKQIADIDSEVKRLDAVIETQTSAQVETQERLDIIKKELAAGSDERKALYGDKSPDDEEWRLNKAISDAEVAEKQVRESFNGIQQKWNTAKAHVESLKKRIDLREPELKVLEAEFSAALLPLEFLNEEQFLAAMLPSEDRVKLTARARMLDECQIDLKARQKDREARLSMEVAREITDKSLEELEPQFKKYEEALKELREAISGLKHKLSENTAAKERVKDKQTIIEGQKKECKRWGTLHELIGSADGKKYRNFAQGLTFEIMIRYANLQLQRMTDRYLLTRDETQSLQLNVIDNYQAGEIRSTKNLSGGESFIVSLSLALGLSHMTSKKVRVDSLFLDEGFGTLDEESLDTALEALASLQQGGKLIGIISHVSALKERISTQIQISPQTGGRSHISGPGCRRLNASVAAESVNYV